MRQQVGSLELLVSAALTTATLWIVAVTGRALVITNS